MNRPSGTFQALSIVLRKIGHGNFIAASYRRICANKAWSRRLGKSYTASARVPRARDRHRAELECANSSDALLMNIFCYPGVLRRQQFCQLLGIEAGLRPEFGARAYIRMQRDEIDRTELDMRLGSLMVEAKLTETGFGRLPASVCCVTPQSRKYLTLRNCPGMIRATFCVDINWCEVYLPPKAKMHGFFYFAINVALTCRKCGFVYCALYAVTICAAGWRFSVGRNSPQ